MSPQLQAFALIALPILLGTLAVGALLLIKVTRRRQGTRDPSLTSTVPVRALSAEDARKMLRRYFVVAGLICGALALAAFVSTRAS